MPKFFAKIIIMNNKALLTLLAFLGWLLFCNWWWCTNKENCDCDKSLIEESTAGAVAQTTATSDAIQFNTSDFAAIQGDRWNSYRDSIGNLVKAGKRLEITGYYGSQEKNTTTFENLGLSRADAIKQLFVSNGISAGRITTRSQLKEELNTAAAPFVASDIAVKDTIATPSANGGVVATDTNDILIYFPSGSSAKEASKEVDDYLTKLGNRLQSSGEKALVTGHTDNKGKYESNLALSKERAEFVKGLLVKHNAVAANINTDGKADKEPVGDNSTDAGRRQNRRVRIQISK
jgi:OmpA-OmpF porin, OOP family